MEKFCQFYLVARAAEILCEKWVILVLRELMMGSTRFGQLRCGLPKISPSILSRRLKSFEEQSIIVRSKKNNKATVMNTFLLSREKNCGLSYQDLVHGVISGLRTK